MKKILSFALALVMMLGMLVIPSTVSAATGSDYINSIELLNALNVMVGYGDGNMGENDNIQRYQMALFFARALTGITDNTNWAGKSKYFADVTEWGGAVDMCKELGIIIGYDDGLYHPADGIRYQDALVMIIRALGMETDKMAYPWGYYFAARDIGITTAISLNTLPTTLIRGETAALIEKMLYTDYSTTATPKTLLSTVFNAEDLGTHNLIATDKFAIDGHALASAGNAILSDGTTERTIKQSFIKTNDIVASLGFSASVFRIGTTYVVTMDDVSASISNLGDTTAASATPYRISGSNLIVGSKTYTPASLTILTYGTTAQTLYETKPDFSGLNTWGEIKFCDSDNDGDYDIVKYVNYNMFNTIYVNNVTVTKASGSWPSTTTLKLYYGTKLDTSYAAVASTSDKNIWTINADNIFNLGTAARGTSLNDFLNAGMAYSSATAVRASLTSAQYTSRFATDLYVTVYGDLVSGVPFVGALNAVGDYTFITVGSKPTVEVKTGVFTGVTADKVIIDGVSYSVGYKDDNAFAKLDSNSFYADFAASATGRTTVLSSTTVDANNNNCKYTLYNGKVVKLETVSTTAPGASTPNPNTFSYKLVNVAVTAGKVNQSVKVDAEGNMLVPVYDAATGVTETIKVSTLNGLKLGAMYNQFGSNYVYTVGTTSYDLSNFDALFAGNKLYAVTGSADGVYSLSYLATDLAKIATVEIHGSANTAGVASSDIVQTLTFAAYSSNGLSTQFFKATDWVATANGGNGGYKYAAARLTPTANTVILVFGKDGVARQVGIPGDGKTLLLDESNGYILELSNDLVVIYNDTADCSDIYTGFTGTPSAPVSTSFKYYTWANDSSFSKVDTRTVANGVVTTKYYDYTFSLWNINNAAYETVVVTSTTYYTNPAAMMFPSSLPAKGNDGVHMVYKVDSNGYLFDSSMVEWAINNDYKIGKIVRMTKGNNFDVDIQNYICSVAANVITLTDNPEPTYDLTLVNGYTMNTYNTSSNAGGNGREILSNPGTNTVGYQGKASLNTLNPTYPGKDTPDYDGDGITNEDLRYSEWAFYKINTDGSATIYINYADGIYPPAHLDTTTVVTYNISETAK